VPPFAEINRPLTRHIHGGSFHLEEEEIKVLGVEREKRSLLKVEQMKNKADLINVQSDVPF
jgi:hypothetical protein